ncbi:protein-L-isoaspartate(D-aspartate) O-methyltransferase [Xanthobacteraceae bacterium A53D]
MTDSDAERAERAAFILALRRRGIRDVAVLRALELVPRALFVDPILRRHAYEDVALPVACGQTMSQPSLVATMTQALSLNAEHKVLEVGTGSGYQAAVLSHLASQVVTLDRYNALVAEAQVRFRVLGLRNVTVLLADGTQGLAERGPYDRIMVTAAGADLPPALMEQLKPGGILVAPMGDPRDVQMLRRFEKREAGLEATDIMPVRFVPLVPGVATTL